jgi:hypothetical protein
VNALVDPYAVPSAPPVLVNNPATSFYLPCDSVVEVTFAGTLYEPTFDESGSNVFTVSLAISNAALGPSVGVVEVPNPPRVRMSNAEDVVPISVTFSTILSKGTYKASVLLSSNTTSETLPEVFIDGALTLVTVKYV